MKVLLTGHSGFIGQSILKLLLKKKIKLIGDKSLSKRDFKRVAKPLSRFGASFQLKNNCNLPLVIKGSQNLKPIKFFENLKK